MKKCQKYIRRSEQNFKFCGKLVAVLNVAVGVGGTLENVIKERRRKKTSYWQQKEKEGQTYLEEESSQIFLLLFGI